MRLHTLGGVVAAVLAAGLLAAPPALAAPVESPSAEGAEATTGDLADDLSFGAARAEAAAEAAATAETLAVTDQLSAGQSLSVGQELVSPNGRWALVLDEFGLFVVEKSPFAAPDSAGAFRGDVLFLERGGVTTATLRTDGNLVLLANGIARASTGSAGSGAVRLNVLDNGNVAMRNAAGGLVLQFNLHRVDALYAGGRLLPGDSLFGDGARTTVTMQTDGNLVLRQDGRARWSSGTTAFPGAFAVLQPNGNLVIRDARGIARWSTGTRNAESLALVRNGALYVFGEGDDVFQTPTSYDTLRRGARLASGQQLRSFAGDCTLQMQTNGNLVARCDGRVVWSSGTFFARSSVTMQTDGNLVIRDASNRARWSTGTRSADAYLLLFGRSADNIYQVVDDAGRPTGEVVGVVDNRTDRILWSR